MKKLVTASSWPRWRRPWACGHCCVAQNSRAQGAQHLQLVGLHRRRHDQELREGDRHQGQLRQLRHQRDPARQAGRRQDAATTSSCRARTSPSCRSRAACSRSSTARSSRNWGNLDPTLLEQLAKVDPGNQYLVDWLWGYVTVGINVPQGEEGARRLPMPENPWTLIFDPKYAQQAQELRRQLPRLGLRGAAGGDALRRQARLQPQRRRLRRRRPRC